MVLTISSSSALPTLSTPYIREFGSGGLEGGSSISKSKVFFPSVALN
jgi:hypothetical protein